MSHVILLDVAKQVSAAIERALLDEPYEVTPLRTWLFQSVPFDVMLIVAGTSEPVSTALALRRTTAASVLLLTAQSSKERAAALEAGADVCLADVESEAIIVAQARALLRRRAAPVTPATGLLEVGALVVDHSGRTARVGERQLRLSPREFELLRYLLSHPSRAIRREGLLSAVWGPRFVGDSNTVDVHIAWLRQKLSFDSGVRITTLRGVGYRLDLLPAT